MENPFTPNFGQIPQVFAGRQTLQREMIEALESPWGHPNQTTIIIGSRGSGKTALLRDMAVEAEQRGWISVNVTCIKGIQEDILQQARRKGKELLQPTEERKITGISLGQLGGLEFSHQQISQNWRSQISDILDELAEHNVGLLLAIDEVDPSLDEMIELAAVYQLLVGEERKIALFMAGLPHRVSNLLTNRSVSFLRRSYQRKLEKLDNADVSWAFQQTIIDAGKTISSEALAEAVHAIRGFPYMFQLVGYRAWQEAYKTEEITIDQVSSAARIAEEDMQNRVLQATLDELSPNDLLFLKAMLDDTDSSRPDDIEQRLHKPSAHVAVYRKRLLEQGVLVDLGRTKFTFALPGLREYLPSYLENNL